MNTIVKAVSFLSIFLSIFVSSHAQTCKSYAFSTNANFLSCTDLPVLSSYLYWNYDSATATVDLAYRHTGVASTDWVAWAINPTAQGMIGSQALVAYLNSSGLPHAYTSPVTGYDTTLSQGDLTFAVSKLSAEFVSSSGDMIIYATVQLPNNTTDVNQVWQIGAMSGTTPQTHALASANRNSHSTLNFATGTSPTTTGGAIVPRLKRKNVHGVLSAVSWGTLMPLGVIIARYMRVFPSADPAWFYLHIGCQSSAYIVGVAGWITGLKLGSDSAGLTYSVHRNIGITLFCLATLQIFALLLRPKKDHKFRLYWNIYHHSIGYLVISLSIVNVFKGFDILDPEKKWKKIYIGILIFLGVNAAMLEAFTWWIVIKMKKAAEKYSHGANGTNGVNGYGTRTQPV